MLNERKLTGREVMKRETSLRGLKKNKSKLVKKYGRDAEKIMYGIATNQAKKKVEEMNKEKIREMVQSTLKVDPNPANEYKVYTVDKKDRGDKPYYKDDAIYLPNDEDGKKIESLKSQLKAQGIESVVAPSGLLFIADPSNTPQVQKIFNTMVGEELETSPQQKVPYTMKYSKPNETWQVWKGETLVTDFARKENAQIFTKRSNELQGINEEDISEGSVPSNISDFAKRNGVLPLVKKVATWAEKSGKRIVGGTAIGKNYSTLVLDITYQGGEIRIDTDNDRITLNGKPIFDAKSFKNALGETEINEEDSNPVDTVTLEIPLLIRILEYSKEDAKTDMDLHKVAEKLIELNVEGSALSMDSYDEIVGAQGEKVDEGMSEEEWADSKEKDRFDALDPKTQSSITKIRALLAKEKGKYKSPSVKEGWFSPKPRPIQERLKHIIKWFDKNDIPYSIGQEKVMIMHKWLKEPSIVFTNPKTNKKGFLYYDFSDNRYYSSEAHIGGEDYRNTIEILTDLFLSKESLEELYDNKEEISQLVSLVKNRKTRGEERKEAIKKLVNIAQEKTGKPVFSMKGLMLALDYEEPKAYESFQPQRIYENKTIKENIDKSKEFGVFEKGGSIGQNQTNVVPGKGKLVSTFDTKPEASEYAKRRKKSLSPGEKGYYGMGYTVVKMSDSIRTQLKEWDGGMGSPDKTYRIEPVGAKVQSLFILQPTDGSLQVNMFFNSPQEAVEFAHKRGLKISNNASLDKKESSLNEGADYETAAKLLMQFKPKYMYVDGPWLYHNGGAGWGGYSIKDNYPGFGDSMKIKNLIWNVLHSDEDIARQEIEKYTQGAYTVERGGYGNKELFLVPKNLKEGQSYASAFAGASRKKLEVDSIVKELNAVEGFEAKVSADMWGKIKVMYNGKHVGWIEYSPIPSITLYKNGGVEKYEWEGVESYVNLVTK